MIKNRVMYQDVFQQKQKEYDSEQEDWEKALELELLDKVEMNL